MRCFSHSLRKHAYSNILKILQPKKNENFQIKNSDIFHLSAQNIDCGYSLEPPRLRQIDKNAVKGTVSSVTTLFVLRVTLYTHHHVIKLICLNFRIRYSEQSQCPKYS